MKAAGWGTVRSVGPGLLAANRVQGLGGTHVITDREVDGVGASSSDGTTRGSAALPTGRITGSSSLPTGA